MREKAMNEKKLNDADITFVTGGNGVILVDDDSGKYPSPSIDNGGILPINPRLTSSGEKDVTGRRGPQQDDEQILV